MSGRLAALRRGGAVRGVWNIAAQVVASANNFLIQVVIARAVSDGDFGSFAVAFSVFSILVGLFRAGATLPVGMRLAAADDAEFARGASSAVGLVLAGGVLGGLVLGAVGLFGPFHEALSHALLALGIVLPGLLLQDAWRQILFARLRPAAACALDAVWGLLQLAAVFLLMVQEESRVGVFILAWGGTALLASIVGARTLRMVPRPLRAVAWIREQFAVTRYLVPEFAVTQSGAQLAVVVVAAVSTTAAAGSLRGANMLAVPATIMTTGLLSFAVPEFSRRRSRVDRRFWGRAALAVSGVATTVGVLWGVVLLLLPDIVGRELLADSWAGTRAVLLPIVLAQIGSALAVGPAAVLYATDGARVTIRWHAVYAVVLITATSIGAVHLGALGTAWGTAIAFWAVAPGWLLALRRHVRSGAVDAPAAVPVA